MYTIASCDSLYNFDGPYVRLSFIFIFNQAFIDLMTKGFPEKFDSQSNQLLTPIKTFVLRLLAIKIIETLI